MEATGRERSIENRRRKLCVMGGQISLLQDILLNFLEIVCVLSSETSFLGICSKARAGGVSALS